MRPLSPLVPGTLAAAVLAGTGCASGYAPIDRGETLGCLRERGSETREGLALPAVAPLDAVGGSEGAGDPVAVQRRGTERPWTVLWFFETAEAAAEAQDAGRLRGELPAGRRQNAVWVFGRSASFGRAPRPAQERRLAACLRQGTRR